MSSSVRAPGKNPPWRERKSSTSSWLGSRPSRRSSRSDVEVADHVLVRPEVLGGRALDRLRQALDESVERLAAQPVGQRLEPLARRRLHEVVLLEAADPAADVAGQGFELVEPLGGGIPEHRVEARVGGGSVRRTGGVVETAVDAGSLIPDDLVELLADVRQDVAQLEPLLELVAAATEALPQVLEAGQVRPGRIATVPAPLHEASQRFGQVAFGHDVIGQRIEDLVGIEGRDRLGAVPPRVARRPGQEPVTG